MKRTVLSMMMAVTAMAGFAADGKLHVKMNVKNAGDSIVVVTGRNTEDRQEFTGKQGVFDFFIEVPEVTTVYLVEPGAFRGDRSARQFQIPVVPGEEVIITAEDNSRYDIDGSTFYSQYHEADITIEEAQKDLNAFMANLRTMMANGTPQDSVMKLYEEGVGPLQQKVEDAITGYIKAHPGYEASAAIIPQLNDIEKMQAAIALLSENVREGRVKPLYQQPLDRLIAYKEKEEAAAKKQAAGVVAPDFTLNDINGKPLTLSSLRGRYVILDFWGSWCGWCIKGFPEMKTYYEKYKGLFEILGVDCNDTEAKWKAAVEKHELPWLHVYNPRESQVLNDYGITGFPTKIVIDPEGKIARTIVGEDPAFYTYLDELFGK